MVLCVHIVRSTAVSRGSGGDAYRFQYPAAPEHTRCICGVKEWEPQARNRLARLGPKAATQSTKTKLPRDNRKHASRANSIAIGD